MHLPYFPGESIDEEVNRSLVTREFKTQLLKFHIARAQQRMVNLANRGQSDRQFQVGDWVYLKIQPYRQLSLSNQPFKKLSAKYYSPCQVLQKVGTVAYKLSLPDYVALRATFHVS